MACAMREAVRVSRCRCSGWKIADLLAFEIHDADEAVLGDERNGQLGADVGVGVDVVFGGGDVVEQDGLAGERDLADDALAERERACARLRRVADLEAHAQIVGAVVEQEDGEDAVGDDGAHQLRGAVEQGLQVERGVERVGHVGEVRKVGGLDAGVVADRYGRAGFRSRRGGSRPRYSGSAAEMVEWKASGSEVDDSETGDQGLGT